MERMLLVFVAVMCWGGVGCSHARYVHRGSDEGVVAIPNRSNEWPTYNQDKATRLIVEHVGSDYDVVEEWSERTGQRVLHDQSSSRQAQYSPEMPFLPAEKVTTQTTSTMSDLTEWRIRYRKRLPGGGGITQVGAAAPFPAQNPIQPASQIIPAPTPPSTDRTPIAVTPPPAIPVLPAP